MEITFGKWRLVPMDDRNWRLREFRAPSGNGAKGTQERWVDTGNFFSSLGHALRFCWERQLRQDGGCLGLAEAMRRAEEIAARLEADALGQVPDGGR